MVKRNLNIELKYILKLIRPADASLVTNQHLQFSLVTKSVLGNYTGVFKYFICYVQIRTIAIIAEGIPENMTRKLIKVSKEKGVSIIGPATVGGIKPGCLKIGNTGGMMDNILHSKLYRPGRY